MRDRRRICRLFYARRAWEAEPEAPQRSEEKNRSAVWRDNPPPCQTRFLRATSYEEARRSETKGRKSEPQTCTTFAAVKTKGAHFVRLLMESSSFLNLACCAGGNCVMTFFVKSCIAKNPDAAKFMFSSICALL